MRSRLDLSPQRARALVLTALAASAACGVEALRTHLWIAALGPICGLDRPALFFLHCPACPAALGFLALAGALAPLALRKPARIRT